MIRMMGRRTQEVYEGLLRKLAGGEFAPGSRLPTEKELCDEFSVGRNTLRQAVGWLVRERRLVTRQGSGTYVLPPEDVGPNANVVSLMCSVAYPWLTELQAAALKRGHLLHLYIQTPQEWAPEAERLFLERVLEARHKALLAFCSPIQPRHDRLLAELVRGGVRVVHVAPYRTELPDEEYIMPDYRRAGYMGAVALMLAGYDELFFVRLSSDGPYAHIQEAGFAEAVRGYGGEYDPARQCVELDRQWAGDESCLDPLREALAGGRSVGIHCRGADQVVLMRPILDKWGARVPEQVGLIGPALSSDGPRPPGIDILEFDGRQVIPRALAVVLDGRPGPVRELVAPRWLRKGCVRNARPKGRG